jgi:hypothetical protein
MFSPIDVQIVSLMQFVNSYSFYFRQKECLAIFIPPQSEEGKEKMGLATAFVSTYVHCNVKITMDLSFYKLGLLAQWP